MPRKREGRSSQRPPAQNTYSRDPSVAVPAARRAEEARERRGAALKNPTLCNGLPHRKLSDGRFLSYGHAYRRVEDKAERQRAEFARELDRLRLLENRLNLAAAAAGSPIQLVPRLRARLQFTHRAMVDVESESWHSDGLTGHTRPETGRPIPPESLRDAAEAMVQDIPRHGRRRRVLNPDGPLGGQTKDDFGQSAAADVLDSGHVIDNGGSVKRASFAFTAAEMWEAHDELFSIEEIRAASKHRGLRTAEEDLLIKTFGVFLAAYQASPTDVHRVTELPLRTIERYQKEGAMLIDKMQEAFAADVREIVDEANERQLRAILAALGIDAVLFAEDVLAEESAA